MTDGDWSGLGGVLSVPAAVASGLAIDPPSPTIGRRESSRPPVAVASTLSTCLANAHRDVADRRSRCPSTSEHGPSDLLESPRGRSALVHVSSSDLVMQS